MLRQIIMLTGQVYEVLVKVHELYNAKEENKEYNIETQGFLGGPFLFHDTNINYTFEFGPFYKLFSDYTWAYDIQPLWNFLDSPNYETEYKRDAHNLVLSKGLVQ